MKRSYDIIVIGGGPAGIVAAKTARALGKKVVILEKYDRLGGECTWTGCVPTKALIKIAGIAHSIKQAKEYYGLSCSNNLDVKRVMEQVRSIRSKEYQSYTPDSIRSLGIEVLLNHPVSFMDGKSVQHGDDEITFKKAIIATGSLPYIPSLEGLHDVSYLTNKNFFTLDALPSSIIIVGAGAIGCEMAIALNQLETRVTIVESGSSIMSKMDRELADMMEERMISSGITIHKNTHIQRVRRVDDQIELVFTGTNNDQNVALCAEHLFIAVGRKPAVNNLNLEVVDVAVTPKSIVVDSTMRTSNAAIYAAGDVVGPYRFTHMAWHQAVIAARNAIIPFFKKHMTYDQLIGVIFGEVELAFLGLSEAAARERYGDSIVVYRYPYATLNRAIIDNETFGIAKVICDKRGYIIGAHILGKRAGDIIHELQVAKGHNIRLKDLAFLVHAFPTYAELNWHLGKSAYIDSIKKSRVFKWVQKALLGGIYEP